MVRKWVKDYLQIGYDILGWKKPLILTFDPNFQRDIQVQKTPHNVVQVDHFFK